MTGRHRWEAAVGAAAAIVLAVAAVTWAAGTLATVAVLARGCGRAALAPALVAAGAGAAVGVVLWAGEHNIWGRW